MSETTVVKSKSKKQRRIDIRKYKQSKRRVAPTIGFWGEISIAAEDVLENAFKDGVLDDQLNAYYQKTGTTPPTVKILRNGEPLEI